MWVMFHSVFISFTMFQNCSLFIYLFFKKSSSFIYVYLFIYLQTILDKISSLYLLHTLVNNLFENS